jgi:hypothetical protein
MEEILALLAAELLVLAVEWFVRTVVQALRSAPA